MQPVEFPSTTTLILRHTCHAPREQVFRAWTDPAALKQWWGPGEFSTPEAEVDLRVGGQYRMVMRNAHGETYHLQGAYRLVQPPEKLVYTWIIEGMSMDGVETQVTVEFIARGEMTEIVLTHEAFPHEAARDNHAMGWTATLGKLTAFVEQSQD